MSLIQTEAVVLASQRLGEADKLVTLFSPDRGKVKAVGRGARRFRSRFGAALEPLTRCTVVLFERKPGMLLRLSQASILESFPGIRGGLDEMMTAGRMARLVSTLMPPGEANENIYALLIRGLREAEKTGGDLDAVAWYFDLHLLKYAGYLPRVDQCVRCRGTLGEKAVYFSAGGGGTVCGGCYHRDPSWAEPVSRGVLAFLAQGLRMPWERLNRMKPTLTVKRDLHKLLEASISSVAGKSVAVGSYTRRPGRPR